MVVGLKEGFNQTVETIQRGQVDVDQGVQLAKNAVVLLGSIFMSDRSGKGVFSSGINVSAKASGIDIFSNSE